MQTSIAVLVGMPATIKALKLAADTKHEPSAYILIPTLAVLCMYQDNYNVCIHHVLSQQCFFFFFFFTAAAPTILKFHFP